MRLFQMLTALGLVLCLTAAAPAAAKAKGKKANAGVRGVVESVDKDSLTVKVPQKKKKGEAAAPAPEEKKFKLSADTKYEVIKITKAAAKGEKPTTETKEGTFDSIHKGDLVQVLANGDLATKVSVIDMGKKKKSKT
jgi:hypothetical protein